MLRQFTTKFVEKFRSTMPTDPPDFNMMSQCPKCKEWVPAIPLPYFRGFMSRDKQIERNILAHKAKYEAYRCKCDKDSQ